MISSITILTVLTRNSGSKRITGLRPQNLLAVRVVTVKIMWSASILCWGHSMSLKTNCTWPMSKPRNMTASTWSSITLKHQRVRRWFWTIIFQICCRPVSAQTWNSCTAFQFRWSSRRRKSCFRNWTWWRLDFKTNWYWYQQDKTSWNDERSNKNF